MPGGRIKILFVNRNTGDELLIDTIKFISGVIFFGHNISVEAGGENGKKD
jgi:hypothetical protein